jgi:hypothetical protein
VAHFWTVITVSGLTATPSSGSLAVGGTITITLTLSRPVALNTQILINPGAHPVTVVFMPVTDAAAGRVTARRRG